MTPATRSVVRADGVTFDLSLLVRAGKGGLFLLKKRRGRRNESSPKAFFGREPRAGRAQRRHSRRKIPRDHPPIIEIMDGCVIQLGSLIFSNPHEHLADKVDLKKQRKMVTMLNVKMRSSAHLAVSSSTTLRDAGGCDEDLAVESILIDGEGEDGDDQRAVTPSNSDQEENDKKVAPSSPSSVIAHHHNSSSMHTGSILDNCFEGEEDDAEIEEIDDAYLYQQQNGMDNSILASSERRTTMNGQEAEPQPQKEEPAVEPEQSIMSFSGIGLDAMTDSFVEAFCPSSNNNILTSTYASTFASNSETVPAAATSSSKSSELSTVDEVAEQVWQYLSCSSSSSAEHSTNWQCTPANWSRSLSMQPATKTAVVNSNKPFRKIRKHYSDKAALFTRSVWSMNDMARRRQLRNPEQSTSFVATTSSSLQDDDDIDDGYDSDPEAWNHQIKKKDVGTPGGSGGSVDDHDLADEEQSMMNEADAIQVRRQERSRLLLYVCTHTQNQSKLITYEKYPLYPIPVCTFRQL